jgi:fascin 1/2
MAESLKITFGLKSSAGKYLTCESLMGGRVNASAASMKNKQIWSFIPAEGADRVVGYFLSSTGLYLSTLPDGKCCATSEAGPAALFEVRAYPDGRWVLISKLGSPKEGAQEYFFGGKGEALDAFNKVVMVADPRLAPAPPADRMWTVQLAMHPQVCIRNVNKKKYVHMADSGDSLQTNEIVPWGDDAMLTLVFFPEGKYGIKAANGKMLAKNGSLQQDADENCKFVLEIRGSQYAFKCATGEYLSSATGPMKATREAKAVTKDELYEFEDSHPQVKMTDYAARKVSVKHGVEFTANGIREAEDDSIRFQLEKHPSKAGMWAFRTHKDKYWSLGNDADGSINCDHDAKSGFSSAQYFTIDWLGPKMSIKASNGKYIVSMPNGNLRATGASNSVVGKDEKIISQYVWELINRPQLVIRTSQGFVNTKPSGALECNGANPEIFQCHVTQGLVQIASSNGKYWKTNDNGMYANGNEPEFFEMVLLDNTKMTLKSPNGCLFQCFQNGSFSATGSNVDESTELEF